MCGTISRNAKSGWRRQCIDSELGWIAYAHICLATCISYARPDLVNVCFGRGLWVLLVEYVHYRKLFINERAHQPLLDSRTIDYSYIFTEHLISNVTYTTVNTAPYAIPDMFVM